MLAHFDHLVCDREARRTPSGTFPAGYLALREKFRAAGQLVDASSPDHYRFAADVVLSSPSAAASIVPAPQRVGTDLVED